MKSTIWVAISISLLSSIAEAGMPAGQSQAGSDRQEGRIVVPQDITRQVQALNIDQKPEFDHSSWCAAK